MSENGPVVSSSAARHRSVSGWFEWLWTSIAERGRAFAPIPSESIAPLERARLLAGSMLAERGEASGAAVARELLAVIETLDAEAYDGFLVYLAVHFQPEEAAVAKAAQAYLDKPSPQAAAQLANIAEPPRQELLRRINMGPGGTAALVQMRARLPGLMAKHPEISLLDGDLRHLFGSWFNRGFLELRQIDWQTPAAILEKLIAYEAVHEIQGWEDLRRRLAPDRRCYAFFHPSLPGEPLIFVEVALVKGLAGDVQALLGRDTDLQIQRKRYHEADTAIFYSISNCQEGLRGISFGNFLIKQVVEELRASKPDLKQFSTLSPIPGFRRWLRSQLENGKTAYDGPKAEMAALLKLSNHAEGDEKAVLLSVLENGPWWEDAKISAAAEPLLMHFCARFLTKSPKGLSRADPVARFHLGNGARLERINWMGNPSERGLRESYGLMVNYLYDPEEIEANHEAFAKEGKVVHSASVAELIEPRAKTAALPGLGRKASLQRKAMTLLLSHQK